MPVQLRSIRNGLVRYRRVLILAIALVVLIIVGGRQRTYSPVVADVSWPNCAEHPTATFETGIIGVTDGLDFRSNPCLRQETTWFAHYGLYMNTGYPGQSYGQKFSDSPDRCSRLDTLCLAYNYGFQAAQYAINYASSQDAHSSLWWLDVETDNSWTSNVLQNRAVLIGAVAAIKHQVFNATVGIYSSPDQWSALTGQWHSRLPAWVGTGALSESAAEPTCRSTAFTGGSLWLSQYTLKVDQNIACSAQFTRTILLQL